MTNPVKNSGMFETVDKLKKELEGKRPLSQYALRSLRENTLIDWTYNSNAIEGNTLTLQETKVVLEGITVGGKKLSEHLEAVNHKEAIDYVYDLASTDRSLSEYDIRSIHQLVLKDIDNDNAGRYRTENVLIAGASHIPPDYLHVVAEMSDLMAWYLGFSGHVIERAARLHAWFVKIHPFIDGNGRTARLMMNFDLMRGGYQPAVITVAERLSYYRALDKGHITNDYTDFIALVVECEIKAFKQVLFLAS